MGNPCEHKGRHTSKGYTNETYSKPDPFGSILVSLGCKVGLWVGTQIWTFFQKLRCDNYISKLFKEASTVGPTEFRTDYALHENHA